MKKYIVTAVVLLALIIAGCANNNQTSNKETDLDTTENRDVLDNHDVERVSEDEEQEIDEVLAKSVGSIRDITFTSIDDYDQERWVRMQTDEDIERGALFDGESIYVYTSNDMVTSYSLDFEENWSVSYAHSGSSDMIMTDDLLITNVVTHQGTEGFIEALEKQTGESRYQIDLTEFNFLSGLTVIDDMLYFVVGESTDPDDDISSDKFTLRKHQIDNGELVWTTELETFAHAYGSQGLPYVAGNLYLTNDERQLIAIDTETGEEVWVQDFPGRLGMMRPTITDDLIYLVDVEYTFHGYDPHTGEQVTDYSYPMSKRNMQTYPLVADSLIIYHDNREPGEDDHPEGVFYLIAADPNEEEVRWSMELGLDFIFGIHLINDQLYVLTSSIEEDPEQYSRLLILEPETGELIEAIEFTERMFRSPGSNYLYDGNAAYGNYLMFYFRNTAYFIQ